MIWSSVILSLIILIMFLYRKKDLRYSKNLEDYKKSRLITVIFTIIYLGMHIIIFINEQKTDSYEKTNPYSSLK